MERCYIPVVHEGSLIGLEVNKSVLLTQCIRRSCRFLKEDSYPRWVFCRRLRLQEYFLDEEYNVNKEHNPFV